MKIADKYSLIKKYLTNYFVNLLYPQTFLNKFIKNITMYVDHFCTDSLNSFG